MNLASTSDVVVEKSYELPLRRILKWGGYFYKKNFFRSFYTHRYSTFFGPQTELSDLRYGQKQR